MKKTFSTQELGGFFPTTLLAHLRHAVAHAFAIPFSSCGLVLQHVALHPEMDHGWFFWEGAFLKVSWKPKNHMNLKKTLWLSNLQFNLFLLPVI